jgi:hypothetical protein
VADGRGERETDIEEVTEGEKNEAVENPNSYYSFSTVICQSTTKAYRAAARYYYSWRRPWDISPAKEKTAAEKKKKKILWTIRTYILLLPRWTTLQVRSFERTPSRSASSPKGGGICVVNSFLVTTHFVIFREKALFCNKNTSARRKERFLLMMMMMMMESADIKSAYVWRGRSWSK